MNTRPRLLVVGNFMSGAVAHRDYCEDFADRLAGRGWSLVRTSTQRNRVRRIADMLHVTWSMRDRYDIAHVDVFSGNSFLWAEAVSFLLRRLGKPFVLTMRGGNLPAFAKRWPRRMSTLLRRATRVTTPSTYLATALDMYAPGITVIPNAVDTAHLPSRLRSTARPRLVWVRAFHSIYNPVMAVDVASLLAQELATTTLTMIGHDKKDGSLEATRQRIDELRLGDAVTIIPGVPKAEVGRHLAEHDVFINTTTVDNTPVSVLEALACGLPTVSTSVGGIPFMLRDQEEALLTPTRDAPAMAAAVRRIVSDANLAQRLSSAGRELALRCDWAPVLDRWERLFEDVARG